MKAIYFFLQLTIFVQLSHANLHDRVRITGQVYRKFTPTRVQIKDDKEQVYEIAREAFPKDFKVEDGKIFSFDVKKEQIFFPKKKKRRSVTGRVTK